jgi:hypothetical protein
VRFSLKLLLVFVTVFGLLLGYWQWSQQPMTYAAYQQSWLMQFIDPVGGSDIVTEYEQAIDSFDAWWKFRIAKKDFQKLAAAVAIANDGPSTMDFNHRNTNLDAMVKNDAKPEWWKPSNGPETETVYWCDKAIHGWYLAYDEKAATAWVWHWTHQWGEIDCCGK